MMSSRAALSSDEGLMMMQELEDRLKEHTDKLEHLHLSALQLRDALTGNTEDLQQCLSEHMDWLTHLSERMESLQMNTAVFVQMNARPRSFRAKAQGVRSPAHWSRKRVTDDSQSEQGWNPSNRRRGSDAASEMSCAW